MSRFDDDGRIVYDNEHPADVILRIDGNWDSKEQRREYVAALVVALNKGLTPK